MAKRMAALVRTPDLTAVCYVACYHPVGLSHQKSVGRKCQIIVPNKVDMAAVKNVFSVVGEV
jgi:hypothetical protein